MVRRKSKKIFPLRKQNGSWADYVCEGIISLTESEKEEEEEKLV